MSETSLDPTAPAVHPCLIALPGRALIAVTGRGAAHFLHSVLTAGIETLPVGKATPAALLTPQGKIVADMLVANASDEEAALFFLDLNRGFAGEVINRLGKYRLRAEVEITELDAQVGVSVALDSPPLSGESFYTFADPRAAGLGQRLYGPGDSLRALGLPLAEEAVLTRRRILLGIPECGADYLPLSSYPHEANLDQLGGVDFKKGCYVGQEIVSRMEYRQGARTRTLIARFLNGFGVDSGAEVRAGEVLLGSIGVSAGDGALAQIRLDKLESAREAGTPICGGGVPVSLEKPAYAAFQA